jgi:ribosomal protein S21
MQLNTKRYGGDPIRTYKALMRKLNREGYYQELKEREYYKSKSQKRREDAERGRVRTQKKLTLIRQNLEKEIPIKNKKYTNKQKV